MPAFILEGILADILPEVRSQARIEVLNDMNLILDEKSKNDQEDKE
ncbi:MAG: hypothetical protein J6A09_01865 [Alphaproteobacteria bacterium]|nr:hypothetical protein [Alphaproteobacteria bacterium]